MNFLDSLHSNLSFLYLFCWFCYQLRAIHLYLHWDAFFVQGFSVLIVLCGQWDYNLNSWLLFCYVTISRQHTLWVKNRHNTQLLFCLVKKWFCSFHLSLTIFWNKFGKDASHHCSTALSDISADISSLPQPPKRCLPGSAKCLPWPITFIFAASFPGSCVFPLGSTVAFIILVHSWRRLEQMMESVSQVH